jgi:hypothetical protein
MINIIKKHHTTTHIRQCQRQRTQAGAKAATADMLTVRAHAKEHKNRGKMLRNEKF